MKNLIRKTAFIFVLSAGSLAWVANAHAQANGNNNQGGPSTGQSQGAQNDRGENDNDRKVLPLIVTRVPSPNDIPRRPRFPKKQPNFVAYQGEKSPCGVIYNQITSNNMLVMVPRYNECIRRGLEY